MHLLNKLNEDDPDRRMQFCAIMTEMTNNNPNCLNHILFADEATFCVNGFVSCRYWSSENPHWIIEHYTQLPQNLMSGLVLLGTTNRSIFHRWKFDTK
jgi:hypothetical protein